MNIEEKREALRNFCNAEVDDESCCGCPLESSDYDCCFDDSVTDSNIEKFYKIVFGDNDRDKELNITKSQVENLITFIDCNFFSEIRADDTIDNMDYVCDICEIYRKLQKLSKSDSNSEETD